MLLARRSRVRVLTRWIFFNLTNPSSCTMALGLTQSLTEMSTRNLPGGVNGNRCVRLTTLPPSVSQLSRENVGTSMSHNPKGLLGLLQGQLYLFFSFFAFIFSFTQISHHNHNNEGTYTSDI
jgi:hypothetical protein